MATLGEQWGALCDELRIAQAEDHEGWAKVTTAFAAVYAGKGPNPAESDMDQWDAARARLEDIKKRMDEFVAKHQ